MGPEHASCNRHAAGKKRAAQLYGRPDGFGGLPDPEPENRVERWSRHRDGNRFNPRCPDCRAGGGSCDAARA